MNRGRAAHVSASAVVIVPAPASSR